MSLLSPVGDERHHVVQLSGQLSVVP